MIIWRGWGILAVGFFLAAGILGIAIPFSIWGEAAKWAMIPAAIAAGAGCWFTGVHLNQTKPRRYLEEQLPLFQQQIAASVAAGTFRLPNQPPPTSLEEARGQAAGYLTFLSQSGTAQTNRNTLFFVPLQYWGIVIAIWGIVMPFLLK